MGKPRMSYSAKVYRNLRNEYGYTEEMARLTMGNTKRGMEPHQLRKVKACIRRCEEYQGD